jgi:glycogen debranching enzyme
MTVSLKEGPLVAVTANDGSIVATDAGRFGLYFHDMRFLSAFELTVNGFAPLMLSVNTERSHVATFQLVNPALTLADGTSLPRQSISIRRTRVLAGGWRERIGILNCAPHPVELTIGLRVDADFRDLFALRGYRGGPSAVVTRRTTSDGLRLRATGSDGLLRETEIRAEPVPDAVEAGDLRWSRSLEPQQIWTVEVEAMPRQEGRLVVRSNGASSRAFDAAVDAVERRYQRFLRSATRIRTSSERFDDEILDRSALDLCALVDEEPGGPVPTAGIPWFATVFGRDALITGFQTLLFQPDLAVGALRVLAAHQGRTVVDETEEEPGKIFHEIRRGELARTGLVPHRPYYGSVDATPLFAWLVAETVRWTGDRALWLELRPHALAALDWCDQHGDPDRDGLVEYDSRAGQPLWNKGWKDSSDSLSWPDGSRAELPAALVEVQGYVYAARQAIAELLAADGDRAAAGRLRRKAAALREQVESAYWLPEQRWYAQGLDASKRPIPAVSSNPGHLLWSGLPSVDRAAAMADRVLGPDIASGWGIRTLATGYPMYNPMSYHNGSIWPHDTSLTIDGLVRYGHRAAANTLATAVIEAAYHFPMGRLPEVWCGFARDRRFGTGPAEYIVANSPQAWAAATPFLLLRGILDARVEGVGGDATLLADPVLPDWLDRIELGGLQALGRSHRLLARRRRRDGGMLVTGDVPARPRAVD